MMMQQRLMELRQASGMNDEEFEELERQVEEELLEAPPTTDETERELEEPHTPREVKKGTVVSANNVSPKSQSTKSNSSKKRSPTSPRRRPVQQNRFEEIPDHVRMEI